MLRKTIFTLSVSALALAGCGDEPAKTEQSPLEQAASQAQTPAQSRNYLTNDPGPEKLTPEILFSGASLSGPSLHGAKISPNGEFVTVLQGRAEDANQQDLWAYDLESGEGRLLVSSTDIVGGPEELSLEEKNRRERLREYGSGIISYDWVGDNLLLFPLGGDIYLYDLETKEPRQVTATKGFETDPKVFGKGQYVAYIRENNLYAKDLETGLERQLSDGATELIRNGIASFVVQEELDRFTGLTRCLQKTDRIDWFLAAILPLGVHRRFEKLHIAHAGNLYRVLKRQKQARSGAFRWVHFQNGFAIEENVAFFLGVFTA